MVDHGLGKRAENHPGFGELFLERRMHGNAVEYHVDRHPGEHFLFFERDTELFIRCQQFRIDFVETLRHVVLGLRCGVIRNRLQIDRRIMHVRPFRLGHFLKAFERFQAPLEHPLGLALFLRNEFDYPGIESRRDAVLFDVGIKTGLVAALYEIVDFLWLTRHIAGSFLLGPRAATG